MAEKLALLDGYSLMYRAFHALKTNMTAPDGTPTNAVHSFMMMLLKAVEEQMPDAVAVAFDVSKSQAHAGRIAQTGPHNPRADREDGHPHSGERRL